MLPLVANIIGKSHLWVFQQDIDSIHPMETRKWLTERQVRTLRCPAKSRDLNIIENVW